jgi:hypothetical protein
VAQYECRTLIVTQADVSFLPLHGCKEKIISIFTSDYLLWRGQSIFQEKDLTTSVAGRRPM